MQPKKKKLLDQVRDKVRLKHYSLKTELAYVGIEVSGDNDNSFLTPSDHTMYRLL